MEKQIKDKVNEIKTKLYDLFGYVFELRFDPNTFEITFDYNGKVYQWNIDDFDCEYEDEVLDEIDGIFYFCLDTLEENEN